MKRIDQIPGDAAPRPSALFRWTVRGLFAACGFLMLLVLLSEPRVSARIGAVLDEVQMLLDAPSAPDASQTAAVDTGLRVGVGPTAEDIPERPAVRAMPQDRVPVRRAGN